MKQTVYKNSFFISGKKEEVHDLLKQLANKFSTVKELIEYYTKNL